MKRFLLNNGSEYSYEQLLASLNESDKYYLLYKQLDLYLFFVNLIKALANNAPLVLLDADLNETEIDGVNVAEINVPTKIVSTTFVNMEAVVEAVKNSTAGTIPCWYTLLLERPVNLRKWYIACRLLCGRYVLAKNI